MMIEEIDKLNKDLEARIKELGKTKAKLSTRLEELERMHKVTMGREKRIIELKDKVWELEKKLKEKEK
jgi:predicted RNase H-like nuclease (RuvC/YqgF family)